MTPGLSDLLLSSQSDERLVSLVRAGHDRAFAAIVERYRPELYALARRLSSDGNGEDVVQQAFMAAFAALRAGVEVKHLRGWLYRIVRNAAARSRTPACLPLDGATASDEALEEVVEQRALALDALAEVARLPSRQRRAFVETAIDGRARAEIASSMGLSEGAVRQLIHRARARLRTVVTAVTPWPLARWFAGGPSGGAGAASAVAGAGAASSGGFVGVKLGVVLASGAIATGVAAVGIHSVRRAHPAAASATVVAPVGGGRARVARRRGQATEAAAAATAAAAPAVARRAPAVVYVASSRPASPARPSEPRARRHVRTTEGSGRSDASHTDAARGGHHDGGGDGGGGGRIDGGGGSGASRGGDGAGGSRPDGGGGTDHGGGGEGGDGGQFNAPAQAASFTDRSAGLGDQRSAFDHRSSGVDAQRSGTDGQGSGVDGQRSGSDHQGSGIDQPAAGSDQQTAWPGGGGSDR